MVQVINFLSILAKNGQSIFALVLVLVLESKGPYWKQNGDKISYPPGSSSSKFG